MAKDGALQAKLASPLRPGYLTTEFWTTVLVQVVSAISVFASLFTHTPFDASGLQPLIPVAAVIAAGLAQSFYSHSRGKVKQAAINNGVNTTPVAPVVYNVITPPTPDPTPVAPVAPTGPVVVSQG
jgi:hypothetical protein